MPEVIKPADRLHKPSRWALLKASIADRVRHHKEKKQQVDQKASTSKKEVKKVVPKSSITPEKKSIPIAKPVTKESSASTVVKKPIQELKRPIDQILVGSWNAIKAIPEKQGKGVVNIYDKLRFPKLTTEEQKVQDKVHVFLKKYQKEIGWGITGVEAAAVTYGVVKGLQYLKKRKLQKNLMRDLGMDHTNSTQADSDTTPHSFQEFILEQSLRGASRPVKKSVKALNDFIHRPAGDDEFVAKLPEDFKNVLPVFAAKFYGFAEKHNVAGVVNPLSDYEAQRSAMSELLEQFFNETRGSFKESAQRLGHPEEDLDRADSSMQIIGILLGILDYPGLEELGVRFKPKPLE